MRLTTKGRYAIRAILDIALHENVHAVSLADISQRQEISQSYLEQLFAKLRRKGLVKSVRGPGGGYLISGDMNNITMAQILEAIDEGSLEATGCKTDCNCQQGKKCLTHDLWKELTEVIVNFLDHKTLAEVLAQLKESRA